MALSVECLLIIEEWKIQNLPNMPLGVNQRRTIE